MCQLFFSHIKRIHFSYKHLFESETEDRETDATDSEDTSNVASSQTAARYYFELTYELANRDITKIEPIENMNLYLCLNTAALMKDRITQEQNEIKKMKQEVKVK